MHSLPLFGLGLALALGGIALFAITLRKPAEAAAGKPGIAPKKSELRALEARATEMKKLRAAGAVCVAVGAVLMILS